jgi:8-oxo-dGTP pyrophosphatase MutT (NUDIX family)
MTGYLLRIAFLLKNLWFWVMRPVILGVRMILVQDGEVLLVRHTYMAGWHFPGGAMNRWETPLEAAAREAREEAGAELLEPPTLVGIISNFSGGKSNHVAIYLCHKFRLGRATDRWEIAECKLFALDALPSQLNASARELLHDLKLTGGED